MQVLTVFPLALLLLALSVCAQSAPGTLAALDVQLDAAPWLVLPTRWDGGPAVMAYTRSEVRVPDAPGGHRLVVVGVRGGAWKKLGDWQLPGDPRWVEPMTLPGGEAGWLLLSSKEFHIGRMRQGALVWQRLCACPSLYALGDPEELGTRLTRDLDGDGVDELVLPTARGTAVYRVHRFGTGESAPFTLEPVALGLWTADGKPLPRAAEEHGAGAPEWSAWPMAKGTRLLRMLSDGFASLQMPGPSAPMGVFVNASTRAKAASAGLSAPALAMLARVPNADYRDAAAFIAAAAQADPGGATAADIPPLLLVLRGGWAETPPEHTVLPGLNVGTEDKGYVLALDDITGDGLPDLTYGLVRNERNVMKAESDVRFYPGTAALPLTFGVPQILNLAGPAVGTVLHTGPKDRVLLVARTDASFGALLRALSSHELTVETRLYPMSAAGLAPKPARSTQLTFKGFGEGAQVLVVSADLQGNGRSMVLLNLQPDALSAFGGDGIGPDFSRAAATLAGPLPRKREEMFVGDWTGTGRESVLLWYRGKKFADAQRRTLRLITWAAN